MNSPARGWPSLWETSFSELINVQKEEKKEKEIKRKKKSTNNRKPMYNLYIMYYSATRNLSSDIRYCSIWHVYKIEKCRTRGRLSSCGLPLLTGPLLFHYRICCSPAYRSTLQGLSPSPHHANWFQSRSCSSRFLPGTRQSRHVLLLGEPPLSPSAHNTLSVYFALNRCRCIGV